MNFRPLSRYGTAPLAIMRPQIAHIARFDLLQRGSGNGGYRQSSFIRNRKPVARHHAAVITDTCCIRVFGISQQMS